MRVFGASGQARPLSDHGFLRGRRAPPHDGVGSVGLVTSGARSIRCGDRGRNNTQTVLPSAKTAAMLFWALLASGQITMRKVDGWQTLAEPIADATALDLAA
jgi:hypothetical protein